MFDCVVCEPQASLPDGTRIFIEQICHHPPVTAFEMIGPNGSYAFDGLSQPGASFKGNSVKTRAAGYRRVSFRDGSVITVSRWLCGFDSVAALVVCCVCSVRLLPLSASAESASATAASSRLVDGGLSAC